MEKESLAGLLHDIGKIGTPEGVLSKRDKLTDEDFAKVRGHPAKGVQIIAHIKQLSKVIPGSRHHHERFDGDGYPDGLSGDRIPLVARILAVADAYDAMTSERPYRKPLKEDEAIRELKKNSGTQFDKNIVAAMLRAMSRPLHLRSPRN